MSARSLFLPVVLRCFGTVRPDGYLKRWHAVLPRCALSWGPVVIAQLLRSLAGNIVYLYDELILVCLVLLEHGVAVLMTGACTPPVHVTRAIVCYLSRTKRRP